VYPLRRPPQPMPPDVAAAIAAHGLGGAYAARPPYQRNDYLAWIGRAKRDDTRAKRIDRMLGELAAEEGYMGMEWRPGRTREP
jgi:uncharacterized protein YdeI (YjbR/CyaY-like superfamily)